MPNREKQITVHAVTEAERSWVEEVYRSWGADFVVSRGRKVYPRDTEGLYAADVKGNRVGLLTFQIVGEQCEVVTLDAFEKFRGIGTALMNRVIKIAEGRGCKRVWLITTNDNLDAMRFYHRRGFVIAAVHVGVIEESRKMKPTIPLMGCYGIPIRDEVEFEMRV